MLTHPSLYSTVDVTVARPDGKPVPGAVVLLYTGLRQMAYATTDAAGRHTFTQVPEGQYGVRAIPPSGFVKVETVLNSPPADAADGLQVRRDSAAAVHLVFLEQGSGTLVVRLNEPTGAPIANARVTLYDPKAIDDTARTDQNGRVTFANVSFGVHGVVVDRPLFYRDFQRLQDSLTSFRDGLIAEKDSRDSVEFVLTKCVGTVDVAVVDQANQPVGGATVAYFTPTDGLGTATTGADGHARRDGPCATQIGVSVSVPAGYAAPSGRGSSFADGITVSSGTTARVTLRVQKTS